MVDFGDVSVSRSDDVNREEVREAVVLLGAIEGDGGLAARFDQAAAEDGRSQRGAEAILEEARATPDHATRVDLYHRAQEILVDDAVEVWGHSDFAPEVLSERVGGYRYSPIMGMYFQPLWLNA